MLGVQHNPHAEEIFTLLFEESELNSNFKLLLMGWLSTDNTVDVPW